MAQPKLKVGKKALNYYGCADRTPMLILDFLIQEPEETPTAAILVATATENFFDR